MYEFIRDSKQAALTNHRPMTPGSKDGNSDQNSFWAYRRDTLASSSNTISIPIAITFWRLCIPL